MERASVSGEVCVLPAWIGLGRELSFTPMGTSADDWAWKHHWVILVTSMGMGPLMRHGEGSAVEAYRRDITHHKDFCPGFRYPVI